jgi:hypothetical protein
MKEFIQAALDKQHFAAGGGGCGMKRDRKEYITNPVNGQGVAV